MSKNNIFILYNWLTVAVWATIILLISMIPDLDIQGTAVNWTFTSIGYALMYALLFLLLLRAILATLRLKVGRLMYFRSKGEKAEDHEFALITEFLVVMVTFLSCILFSCFEEYVRNMTPGRVGDISDILFNAIGITVVALFAFGFPIITEFETRVFHSVTKKSTGN
jgi:hypothetical protein